MPPETPTSTSQLLLQRFSPCPTPEIHHPTTNSFGDDEPTTTLQSSRTLGKYKPHFCSPRAASMWWLIRLAFTEIAATSSAPSAAGSSSRRNSRSCQTYSCIPESPPPIYRSDSIHIIVDKLNSRFLFMCCTQIMHLLNNLNIQVPIQRIAGQRLAAGQPRTLIVSRRI